MINGDCKTTNVIDYLRDKMILRAESTGDLLHQDVIRLSQQLDQFLVQAQKCMQDEMTVAPETDSTPWWPLQAAGGEPSPTIWALQNRRRKHLRMVGDLRHAVSYKR
ncbi:aspartyl-phosphate phosphatase Spo0E family protein [Alicyclobacillus fastidiosus]|uniref:Aspartyl-phosphate phosphatase Spo0E family protein n=1 Tax=Alicyclobacillus fastidiosus TaxID=392011 RepID=A0ABV5AC90_9BACL|nr:aspartyl-phosphate phosphatase Spo0E family protein [Alicyclobacillus fastidiosus]WEH11413.1 aspartyl-phosphate phosphatase Spo0E family protein [Alicyclobacillus fastidiosus]